MSSKRFQIDRTRVELLIEAINVDNHSNFNNPIGNLAFTSFGSATR